MVLDLKGITKKYNGETVLEDVSMSFETGKRYLLKGVSGAGKTTLIRLIMGLEEPDAGLISIHNGSGSEKVLGGGCCDDTAATDNYDKDMNNNPSNDQSNEKRVIRSFRDYKKSLKTVRFGTVFQEDRLCDNKGALTNIRIVNSGLSRDDIMSELDRLLPKEDINKPVSELSGGMKRRVSLIRACAIDRDIYLLDEPFTGLDSENAIRAAGYIDEKTRGGILIITSHTESVLSHISDLKIYDFGVKNKLT